MLLAQDGFAASDRIDNGLQSEVISGAIISASCRQPANLSSVVQGLKDIRSDAFILFDSEFYVGSFPEADKFGKLTDYQYFKHPLQKIDLINPTSVQGFIKKVVDVQLDAGLDNITSPTIRIQTFNSGSETQVFSFLFGTLDYVQQNAADKKLYGSLLINELALTNSRGLAEFLDTVTALRDYAGFYIIIDRSSSTISFWNNPDTLASLMYLVHVLSDNGFQIVVGYSDGDGLLSLATGASYVASGWWQNTTNFTDGKFKSSGGRRRKKYYSYQLMNAVYQEGELSSIVEHGLGSNVMGITGLDDELAQDPLNVAWPDGTAILHKWKALNQRIQEDVSSGDETAKLEALRGSILVAKALYEQVESTIDIEFDIGNGPKKLDIWLKAIEIYQGGVV